MSTITPQWVDGEPVCDSLCPGSFVNAITGDEPSCVHRRVYVPFGASCVPALRQQRDEALARVLELEARLEAVRALCGETWCRDKDGSAHPDTVVSTSRLRAILDTPAKEDQ